MANEFGQLRAEMEQGFGEIRVEMHQGFRRHPHSKWRIGMPSC